MSIEQGLAKTRGGFFARLFGRGEQPITAEWLDSLEEALLRSDLSVSLVDPLMAQLRDLFTTGELKSIPKAVTALRETLVAVLAGDLRLRGEGQKPRVVLVVGVNGSGKTTTAAKLAKRLKDSGERPLLAAADTFRAAATDQLEIWAKRVGSDIVRSQPGADSASVVFDAIQGPDGIDYSVKQYPFNWNANLKLSELKIAYFKANFERRAQDVLAECTSLLERVSVLGLMNAIEGGIFADVRRSPEGGRGFDGVFERAAGYWNPFEELLP